MGTRLELHQVLVSILGSSQVYFQPPESIKMVYPCIVYERSDVDTKFANNAPYHHTIAYTVTVIDKNPDSDIPGKIADLPMSYYDRHYTSDNLNHDVYRLYY